MIPQAEGIRLAVPSALKVLRERMNWHRHFANDRNLVMGESVEQFERRWAQQCGAEHCVGVSSGTDALFLTLRYLEEYKEIRKVYTTPFTFIATVEAALRAGLEVQLGDIDLDNACLLPPVSLPGKTAYYPVDLYGYPAPLARYDAGTVPSFVPSLIIVDSAQSHGLSLRSWAACHSFYPTKNLGAAGQAGAVVTDDADLTLWLRKARRHGEGDDRFVHEFWSGNYRMDELQAAILNWSFDDFVDAIPKRKRIAQQYRELLNLYRLENELVPQLHTEAHQYHIFATRILQGPAVRARLMEHLKLRGVETAIRYPVPIHLQPAWQKSFPHRYKQGEFPNAELWADQVLTLPMHPELSSDDVETVVREIARFFRGK